MPLTCPPDHSRVTVLPDPTRPAQLVGTGTVVMPFPCEHTGQPAHAVVVRLDGTLGTVLVDLQFVAAH